MILKYEEAVKQTVDLGQLGPIILTATIVLLLLTMLVMFLVFSNRIREKKQIYALAIICVASVLLLISYFPIRQCALEGTRLEDESSYYASQIEEKYDMYVLPDMSTDQWSLIPQHWWEQEFYAISNETDEVKTYRLEEIKDGYMTLIDTKDGKALGIHQ